MQTETVVFDVKNALYPNEKINGQMVAHLGGCVMKGTLEQGDQIVSGGKPYGIIGISKGMTSLDLVNPGEYITLTVLYMPINGYKVPFVKGAYKIEKGVLSKVSKELAAIKEQNRKDAELARQIAREEADGKEATFCCDGCGKTFPIKYRYKANLCAECAEKYKDRALNAVAPPDDFQDILTVSVFCPTASQLERMRNLCMPLIPDMRNHLSYPVQMQIKDMLLPLVSLTVSDMLEESYWKKAQTKEDVDEIMTRMINTIHNNIAHQKLKFTKKKVEQADRQTLLKAWFALDYYVSRKGTTGYPYITALRNYVQGEFFKRYVPGGAEEVSANAGDLLEDVTYIREIRRNMAGVVYKYDILLNAACYGWERMKNWAEYMARIDLEKVAITAEDAAGQTYDITPLYMQHGRKDIAVLDTEWGKLCVAGRSRTLQEDVEIVWYNQTRMLQIFTMVADEQKILRYAETMARRTFGTEQAMRLGRPIPPEAAQGEETSDC